MITLRKGDNRRFTFSRLSVEELVDEIRSGRYADAVNFYQQQYRNMKKVRERAGRQFSAEQVKTALPTVIFQAQYANKKKMTVMEKVNYLVLLEIDSLSTDEAVRQIAERAAKYPYTHVAFVGSDGRSVKIVCKYGELGADGANGQRLAGRGAEDEERLLKVAYDKLHHYYTSQLGMTLSIVDTRFDSGCLMSNDPQVYYNADSEVMLVSGDDELLPAYSGDDGKYCDLQTLPNYDQYVSNCHVFEWCRMNAMQTYDKMDCQMEYVDMQAKGREQVRTTEVLKLLAKFCHESGLPKAFAVRKTLFSSAYWEMRQLVELVFENEYAKELRATMALKHIPASALLAYRTEAFMQDNYELRRNVMTRKVEYRMRIGLDYDFTDLTERVRNSMTQRALKLGLGSWDKDLQRYIESNDIAEYHPLDDYLEKLPRWDGTDRVTAFIRRVPTDTPHWEECFRIWLRAMVKTWTDTHHKHGNSIVPLLIGSQGCGKSTFCRMILPRELRRYYNENINFKNQTDITMSLSSMALINMDEFDKLTKSQQPLLKFLISTNNFQARLPYGSTFEQMRKCASFIATTNNHRPLTDKTGSRRYLCVEIRQGQVIDFDESGVNYPQLYAQLYAEVKSGEPVFFNDSQMADIMDNNAKYQQITDCEKMITMLFRNPMPGEEIVPLTLDDIVNELDRSFPSFERNNSSCNVVGRIISRLFPDARKRTGRGMVYHIVVV